jgi:hypothetical protein
MLRPESGPQPAAISDRELGVAALLLLVAVVLTALVVPALI